MSLQEYNEFKFIFPPRPERKITPASLGIYDSLEEYYAQVKYNGSCCNVFLIPGEPIRIINRHSEPKTRVNPDIDFAGLMSDKPMVLSGELMDKSKLGEDKRPIKGFIIWDILVHEGRYLIESTLEERLDLLENLWPTSRAIVDTNGIWWRNDHLSFTRHKGIFKAPTYANDFAELYKQVIKVDAYEGLVLKKRNAKLTYGFNEKNNSLWQLKCRKPTRNYAF